ncbi:MAG TPA: S16 family serine protease [Tepidisphaeraceae bacterium]|nr:S16 family serine protease [Tepidisphaeraceae bacterium]
MVGRSIAAIAGLVWVAFARGATAAEFPPPQVITGAGDIVYSIAVFDGGKRVVVPGKAGRIGVYDTATGKEVDTLDGHIDRVNCIVVSHDGTRLASASYDDTCRLWDLKTLKLIKSFKLPTNCFTVSFSADDKALLVSGSQNFTRVIDIETGAGLRDNWTAGYTSEFAPEGRAFVAVKDTVRMWDAVRDQRWSAPKPKGSLHRMAFTPDGAHLLIPCDDHGVIVLNTKDGREVRRFTVHGEGAYGLAVSPDGSWALVGTNAGRVYQIEFATGRELRKFEGHTRGVTSIVLWPGANMFATGSVDGTVRTWRLDATNVVKPAPAVVTAIPVGPGNQASTTAPPAIPGMDVPKPGTGTAKPPVATPVKPMTPSGTATENTRPATPAVTSVVPPPPGGPIPPTAKPGPIERPEFRDKAKPVQKHLTSVTSMMVRVAADGTATGITSDVIATVPAESRRERDGGARFAARRVGEHMEVSMEEAVRAVKIRYPRWGGEVALSFGEKYTEHDGGSAGAAFAVLLLSTLEGIDLDPKCAITGDVTVDWKVRKVGAVAAKVRGATVDGCLYAAIPAENESALADMALLNGDAALWDIQTVGVATVQDAVDLVRVDRPQALAEALRLFAGLQPQFSKSGRGALRDVNTLATLRRIVALAPNHFSAKLLVSIAENRPPQALTAGASLYEISVISYPYQRILKGHERATRQSIPVTVTNNARRRIQKLRPIVHKDLQVILNDLSALVEKVEAAATGKAKEEEVAERREVLFQHLAGISADKPEVLEKLVREGY